MDAHCHVPNFFSNSSCSPRSARWSNIWCSYDSISKFLSFCFAPSMTVLDTVGGKLNSLFINLLFNSSARLCTAPSSICLFPVFKSFRIFPGVYSQCRESRFRISRRFHFPLKQFRIASSIIEISSISTFLQYVFIYVNF